MFLNTVTYMYCFVFYMVRPAATDPLRKQFTNEQHTLLLMKRLTI
jgi:hypothetical protein